MNTACLHPTGRHWVDKFLTPILLVHQFEHTEREDNIYLKQQTMECMMKYFFLASHVQCVGYLTQYLLEMCALPEEANVDIVCRTIMDTGILFLLTSLAIKICKGALKSMSLSAELVSEWIDAFPITVHMSDCGLYLLYLYTRAICTAATQGGIEASAYLRCI